jgi:predicted O-linked N-acetylglucosamine transferase (SPINDLY family)
MMSNSMTGQAAAYDEAAALLRLGRLEDANLVCERSLRMWPEDFSLLHLCGIIALQAGRPARAAEIIGRALRVKSTSVLARYHHANALFDLGQYAAAIEGYDRVIALEERHAPAHSNRGLAHWRLRQHRAAIECYDRTLEIDPRNAQAHNFRGHALRDLEDYPAAIACYDAAIALDGDYAEAHNGRGSALAAQYFYGAALSSFDRAIAVKDDFAEAHLNRGNVLKELDRFEDALASYDQALAIDPNLAEAHYRRGDLQRQRGCPEAALASYDRAASLKPDMKLLLGMRCLARMQLCDWHSFAADIVELTARIERGEPACPPMAVLAFCDDVALQRRAAQVYVYSEHPPVAELSEPPAATTGSTARRTVSPGRPADRIRIGYFSPDFREHPVAYLTAELFESHDRGSFEVTAFSFGPRVDDPMSRRLQFAFERVIDVRRRSDREVAQLARELELDIAVDLCGFTENCRPGIFAQRAAPLQISYLGYLGTMAAPYIDYLVADSILVPRAASRHYAEKIIRLPSYQANSRRPIAVSDVDAYGLPPSAFVFCCFNNSYKITPEVFSVWMSILRRVPGGVLFLYAPHAAVADNLRREAASRGVDPGRLLFGGPLAREQYLARYQAADLFLDTWPYNAGTTASDALWTGLPVVTWAGGCFAARMAASILTSAGVAELIAPTPGQYEEMAVELAGDRNRLALIRRRLAAQRLEMPLFDVRRLTRNLESAYRVVYEKYRSGMPADDIDVADS